MNERSLLFGEVVCLWLGYHQVVKKEVAIAPVYQVLELFARLTILSIKISLPELVISVKYTIHSLKITRTFGLLVGHFMRSSFSKMSIDVLFFRMLGVLQISMERIRQHGFIMIGAFVLLVLTRVNKKKSHIEAIYLMIRALIYRNLKMRSI
jgi:Ca2+/Na+ antiporter